MSRNDNGTTQHAVERFAGRLDARPTRPGGHRPGARAPIDHGRYDMRIGRDGTWYYRGSPIVRKPLVKLFASVLVRDPDGQYRLRTPVEQGCIDVDDVPFLAVDMDISEGALRRLAFRTNLDETVIAGPDHPIRVDHNPETGEPSPYIMIRDRLEARLTRAVYYRLVALAVPGPEPDGDRLGVWSDGMFFSLGRRPDDA